MAAEEDEVKFLCIFEQVKEVEELMVKVGEMIKGRGRGEDGSGGGEDGGGAEFTFPCNCTRQSNLPQKLSPPSLMSSVLIKGLFSPGVIGPM